MKKHLIFLSILAVSISACKKDDPEIVNDPEPEEVIVEGYAKTILIEPTVSVSCGACPIAHHNLDVIEDSLSDVFHMSHYIHGPLHHYYTDHFINKINKTVYTPVAHIQRKDEGEGTVYYMVDRLEEMLEGERLSDAPIGLTGETSSDGTMLNVEIELSAIDKFSNASFRLQVFVVEKVVTGQGSGYDQRNYGDNDPDHPYYGQGEYIVGFEHTNVIRHVLSDYDGDMVDLDGTSGMWSQSIDLSELSESLEAYSIIAFITDEDDSVTPVINSMLFEAQP